MSTLPVAILLGATVGMGVILATLYWRGRRKPVLIGVHFLLAALTSSLLGAQQPKAARVMPVTHATAGSTALIVFLVWMTTL